MEDSFDHELLLSVASGIGRWVNDGIKGPVYEKDEDALGKEAVEMTTEEKKTSN